jgi:hypothetical protein
MLLKTALYRKPRGSGLEASSYFSPAELNKFYEDLRSFGELNPEETVNRLMYSLKFLYPESIPLSNLSPNATIIHTPCVRLAFNSDREAKEACAAIADQTLLHHVTGLTYKEPDEGKETPEHRTIRKKIQADTFKKIEAARGISLKSLKLQAGKNYEVWEKYFVYMETRKQAIDLGQEGKITAREIEDVFHKLVSASYSIIKINGWSLYLNKEEIDLNRCNSKGEINLDLLSRGESPIGADGHSMNLHHLTRRQPGVIVLVLQSFHIQHTKTLHLMSEQHMRQPEAINRHHFDWWKKIALKAIGEYLSPTSAPVVRSSERKRGHVANSNAAQPAIAQRTKASNLTGNIRQREAAQNESPVRMQVSAKLF